MKELKNNIKDTTKTVGVSARLISLWTNVAYTTVSSWNSNIYQPSNDNLNEIGELFEKDSRLLLKPDDRKNTGLAQALEKELQRLISEEKVSYVIEQEVNGVKTKTNNPILIQALRSFADKYKKEYNTRLYPFYFDKPLAEIKKREIKNTRYFICKPEDGNEDFNFLVVSYLEETIKPLARLSTLDAAQDYVDYLESF